MLSDETSGPGRHTYTRIGLVFALAVSGAYREAIATSENLCAAADATNNPGVLAYALFADGFAHLEADPARAYESLRRGLTIAQGSGNRLWESLLAASLSRLVVTHGDPMDAFEYLTLAVRFLYDSGSFSFMHTPLAVLAAHFDLLGHHEPAATICGFAAANPFAQASGVEINKTVTHLREVLGDASYESLARADQNMTNAAMANYAFEQIDRARAEV